MKLAFGIGIGIFLANKAGLVKNLFPKNNTVVSNPLNALVNKPITPLSQVQIDQISEASLDAEKVYGITNNYSKDVLQNVALELETTPDILLMSLEESL